MQDSVPSHQSNFVRILKRRFIKCVEWTSSSPDVNPLDDFSWDLVENKGNQDRAGE